MSEPVRELRDAVSHVELRWDERRTERTLAGMHLRHARRRRRARVLGGAGGALALAASAYLIASAPWHSAPPDARPSARPGEAAASATAPTPARRVLALPDGSHASLLDPATRLAVEESQADSVVLQLSAGRARFEVTERPERVFRVRAGAVDVRVLGTIFELERRGERTRVAVARGRVAVSWSDGRDELGAGESGWFPPSPPSASERTRTAGNGESTTDDEARVQARPGAVGARKADRSGRGRGWREHAEDGDFGRAYELLERARVTDDVEELMLAADAARLSGHAVEAVPFLRRVIDGHAADPRAPLAAFTLGGVLMHQLGRPREAEAAYGRARALSLGAALAQDALARQVEAAHRAGDAARARSLALDYLERYPNGRRVNAVRRFGGLK